MKTNIEAQQLIYKKAKDYFYRRKQLHKKIVLNTLVMFLILPVIVLSFTMNIYNTDNTPIIDNSVGGSSMVTSNTESSTIPQRKIVYSDEEYLSKIKPNYVIGTNFYYDEELLSKYTGQDVAFFVVIEFGSLKDEAKVKINNTPLKGAELYPDITWNEFQNVWDNFIYHYEHDQYTDEYTYDSLGNKITYGEFIYDLVGNRIYKDKNVTAEIERMFEYNKNIREELNKTIVEYQRKLFLELDFKHLEYGHKNSFYGYFGNITFEDIEKLKTLPFGVQVICLPENIEELPPIG